MKYDLWCQGCKLFCRTGFWCILFLNWSGSFYRIFLTTNTWFFSVTLWPCASASSSGLQDQGLSNQCVTCHKPPLFFEVWLHDPIRIYYNIFLIEMKKYKLEAVRDHPEGRAFLWMKQMEMKVKLKDQEGVI